jgi:regulator of nonsense transcripts 1
VIGREELTNSEQAQYHFLRFSFTDARRTPPFVTAIWSPGKAQEIEHHDDEIHLSSDHASKILEKLNNSQREIVGAMLSSAPQDSLVIAHGIVIPSSIIGHSHRRCRYRTGPPGTGKTTTIAAAAAIWASHRLPCWIIAHSNVGVKNIAEKLFEKEVDFRLIVSQEFLFEW